MNPIARTSSNLARAVRRLRRRSERGVALLMVLGALTILTILLTEFQDETSAEFGSALSARDAIQAEYAARSAVNLSRLLLASEPTIRKSLAIFFLAQKSPPPQIPVWEFADQVLGAFNDEVGGQLFQSLAGVKTEDGKNLGLGLPGVGFEVKILDEDSKINLNSASRESISQVQLSQQLLGLLSPTRYDPLFDNRDSDGQYSDRAAVCSAVIDWVDSNQELASCDPTNATASQGGPEDSFYQLLKDPYERKNAPFDSLEELRMVRGVGDDFWSTFVEPDFNDPTQRTVTVWGKGQINVNTANAQTLAAFICGTAGEPLPKMCTDPEELLSFLSLINMLRTFTAGVPLFGTPQAFLNALQQRGMYGELLKMFELEPVKLSGQAAKQISTESKVFSIYSTGYVRVGKRETKVRVHAVIDFRGAPKPPTAEDVLALFGGGSGGAAGDGAGGASASGAGADDTQLPDGAGADAIAATFRPDPAGRIIYYRED